MMPSAFAHVCIRVHDVERFLAFHESLGFEQRGRLLLEDAFNTYVGLPNERETLELTVSVGRDQPYELGTGYGHVATIVDDLDKAPAALADQGIALTRPPFAPGGREELRITFLEDPSGYHVEVIDGGGVFTPPNDPTRPSQTTA
jgi:lactoylglutathione lyase